MNLTLLLASILAAQKLNELITVTYLQFQNNFREIVACTGRNKHLFSSHRLRCGAASWAFHQDRVSDRCKSKILYHDPVMRQSACLVFNQIMVEY